MKEKYKQTFSPLKAWNDRSETKVIWGVTENYSRDISTVPLLFIHAYTSKSYACNVS